MSLDDAVARLRELLARRKLSEPTIAADHFDVDALLDEREEMGELLAAQRAELCLAYDVITQLPDSALDHVEEAKLLRLMQRMDEEQKRAVVRDKMSDLVTENERLRALLGEEEKA